MKPLIINADANSSNDSIGSQDVNGQTYLAFEYLEPSEFIQCDQIKVFSPLIYEQQNLFNTTDIDLSEVIRHENIEVSYLILEKRTTSIDEIVILDDLPRDDIKIVLRCGIGVLAYVLLVLIICLIRTLIPLKRY